ncbi:MAG: hypothetical protein ACOVVK_12850, partial [Elsteraceae bacterium]
VQCYRSFMERLDQAISQLDSQRKQAEATLQRQSQRLVEAETRVAAIKSDQERQRANLASAPRDSDLAKRSLTAISLQEDELGLLSKTRAMLESDRTKAQQALEAGVMAIKF